MQSLCKNTKEFVQVLDSFSQMNGYHFNRNREKGFMVTTKVRRDFMTSEYQGKYCIQGWIYDIKFENLGGGVWKVFFFKGV